MLASAVVSRLRELGDPDIAAHSQRFFKTGPGEYGEGDRFLGIRMPVLRGEAKRLGGLSLAQCLKLLRSPFHEARLLALLLLARRFEQGDEEERDTLFRHYLEHTAYINNWDLVDSSAPAIVGGHLARRDRSPLDRLAASPDLWERRIAVLACLHFIRQDDFRDALRLCAALLRDPEDLIHKATGWMLREIGKRDGAAARAFLERHSRRMPRTMLRYAIEKFPPGERQRYLKGAV